MTEKVWLTAEEVSYLTGEVKETVRRKCKRGEYACTYKKDGKYKNYFINLESLPELAKNKYYGKKINSQHSKFYKEAPAWAKKQAKKYVELIKLTKGMKHIEIVEFLQEWNKKHPDKKSSYPALCKARIKYEQLGEDALLSKKGLRGDKYCIRPEYYNYYKDLYLSAEAPSTFICWIKTLDYAQNRYHVKTANFPCERTFDRLLKANYSSDYIQLCRRRYDDIIARDYSNITANEYWYVDSCQLKFQIRYGKKFVFPWLTVVKDVKTSKWLGWFIYYDLISDEHALQAIYYALLKYGRPKKIFIKNEKFDSYINTVGKKMKTDIHCNRGHMYSVGDFVIGATIDYKVPKNIKMKTLYRDLIDFEPPDFRTDMFELKDMLDEHIENVINERPFRTKLYLGKTPNELWKEEYKQQPIPDKRDIGYLCIRNRNPIGYKRNGLYDVVTDRHYWGDWMPVCSIDKMYFRRDIYSEDDALVYRADNEAFIGTAYVLPKVPALVLTEEDREILRAEMARKKRALRAMKEAIKPTREIPIEEIVENYKRAYESYGQTEQPHPKITKIANTKMDKAIRKNKEMEAAKQVDLSMFLDDSNVKKEEPLYLFETDKILEEEYAKMKAAANVHKHQT